MCIRDRFVIIVTSIAQDFLPGAWDFYHPSRVEIWTFVGTFGLFMGLFLLFLRFLPCIAVFEVKGVLPESDPHYLPPETFTHDAEGDQLNYLSKRKTASKKVAKKKAATKKTATKKTTKKKTATKKKKA